MYKIFDGRKIFFSYGSKKLDPQNLKFIRHDRQGETPSSIFFIAFFGGGGEGKGSISERVTIFRKKSSPKTFSQNLSFTKQCEKL